MGPLYIPVGTTSSYPGYPSYSSSRTPTLGAGLVSSLHGDGVWLSLVLGDVSVNESDDIVSNRSGEYPREFCLSDTLLSVLCNPVYTHHRSRCHLYKLHNESENRIISLQYIQFVTFSVNIDKLKSDIKCTPGPLWYQITPYIKI